MKTEIINTTIALIIFLIVAQIMRIIIKKFSITKRIDINRRKVILNVFYFLFYVVMIIILAIIWGIEFKQFTVFISSVLAVLGIGFFAQWSILSNLTASVILFFYHPLRIGDRIKVLDSDFDWTGVVTDITGFYLFLKTDKNEDITIPNSLVVQKGIEILSDKR